MAPGERADLISEIGSVGTTERRRQLGWEREKLALVVDQINEGKGVVSADIVVNMKNPLIFVN